MTIVVSSPQVLVRLAGDSPGPELPRKSEGEHEADCTRIVEFMLGIILRTIEEVDAGQPHEQIDEQIDGGLDARRHAVLEYLRTHPKATFADIAAAIGVSVATARRDVAKLRELGMVRREGSRKSGVWVVS